MCNRLISAAFITATFLFSACASTPDPAKVCTVEWIAPRADRAMNDFKSDTKSIFKRLRKAGDSYMDNGRVGPLQMMFLMGSINKLADKFENGRAMRDMRTLAKTCDDPKLIKNAMTKFMREQGIDERFVRFLNNMDAYKDLIETGKTPRTDR